MKPLILFLVGLGLIAEPLSAGETIFGAEGSGRPTNTIVGTLFGAATGAAIGQATGGEDGWWIGSLVGSALGGTLGNLAPTDSYSSSVHSHRPSYYHRSAYSRSYSRPRYQKTVYRSRPVVREVVVEQPVVIEHASVPDDLAPYGFLDGGQIRSPWSDFEMSVGGLSPGQTVYDGLTGKPFRVP